MSPTQQNKLTLLVKRSLDVLRIFFFIVAVVWPIAVLVVGFSMPDDPDERTSDVSVFLNFRINSDVSNELTVQPESKSELLIRGRGDLQLNNTRSQLSWFLSGAISEVLLFIFLYGLLTMRKLFASLIEKNTFTFENAERIKKIGYVFVVWHCVSPLLQYFGSRIMLQDIAFNAPGIELFPAFELNLGGIFAGFAIIVLSGILREAANIHHDQSLTI
ncbi:MAG: hypothetical protein ACI9HY_001009 [Planctomycetaceae bacterium]|jgi:hypothetical protein